MEDIDIKKEGGQEVVTVNPEHLNILLIQKQW